MIYVKNKDLKRALLESKEKGELTSETVKMFTLIVKNTGIDTIQQNQIIPLLSFLRLHTTV